MTRSEHQANLSLQPLAPSTPDWKRPAPVRPPRKGSGATLRGVRLVLGVMTAALTTGVLLALWGPL